LDAGVSLHVFEEGMPDSGSNERFSVRTVGLLAPATDGSYRFAVSSDDNSALYLSTDDQPANRTKIAFETGLEWQPPICCDQSPKRGSGKPIRPANLDRWQALLFGNGPFRRWWWK